MWLTAVLWSTQLPWAHLTVRWSCCKPRGKEGPTAILSDRHRTPHLLPALRLRKVLLAVPSASRGFRLSKHLLSTYTREAWRLQKGLQGRIKQQHRQKHEAFPAPGGAAFRPGHSSLGSPWSVPEQPCVRGFTRDTRVRFDPGPRGRGLCSEGTRAALAGGPPGVTDVARPGCGRRGFGASQTTAAVQPPLFLAHFRGGSAAAHLRTGGCGRLSSSPLLSRVPAARPRRDRGSRPTRGSAVA